MNKKRPVIGVGSVCITERAKTYVMDALNNHRLSYGPFTQRLEKEFAALHGCRFGVMSNSGTSALQIALQALKEMNGWQDGDEVIVPAVTFVATANIVLHNRMKPVLVDVDPIYYELDPAQLEAKITPRTRAIIPVHLFGQPADMDAISEIAKRRNLKIIEDSCETMFASYKGRPVGSLGDIGCFSTYVAHLLVTGVGGLNTTNNPDYAVRLHSLMNHGRDSIYLSIDDDKGKSAEELELIVARRFHFVSVGHSFRATELEAAIGVAQLENWSQNIATRRANAQGLMQRLAPYAEMLQLPQIRPGCEHSFMMFPIVLRDREKKDLVNFLEEQGVGTRDMLPLTNQPVYQNLGWKEDDYPTAKWVNQSGFYIGCHPEVTESDLDYMGELFGRFFRKEPAKPREGACLVLVSVGSPEKLDHLWPEIPAHLFSRIIALDDGLSPESAAFLKRQNVDIVSGRSADALPALQRGQWSVQEGHVVLFPADGRHNPNDIGRVVLALERGSDMVVASRFLPGGARHHPYAMFQYRSLGNRFFTVLANMIFMGNLSDTLSTFRGFKWNRMKDLPVAGSRLPGVYEISIEAVRRGLKVTEIPTVELTSPGAQDRLRALGSVVPLLFVSLKEWWRGRPSK